MISIIYRIEYIWYLFGLASKNIGNRNILLNWCSLYGSFTVIHFEDSVLLNSISRIHFVPNQKVLKLFHV